MQSKITPRGQYAAEFNAFLRLLGIQTKKVSLLALAEIIRAHLYRIPFENISKLYYFKRDQLDTIPSLEQYLSRIEKYGFGGTCYTNNYYLGCLLKWLGFKADFCAADMNRPDCHMVITVSINGVDYLVDTGYAAPFLKPVPLNLKSDYILQSGRDKYIFKPRDQAGRTQLHMYRNGKLRHGYLVKPRPQYLCNFAPAIRDSFRETATFTKSLLVTKYLTTGFAMLHNHTFTVSQGIRYQQKHIKNNDELVRIIDTRFQIRGKMAEAIIETMDMTGDAWN